MATKKKLLQAAAGAGGADSYWIALLGGSGTDEAKAVAVDSSDNIIIAGNTSSDGQGGHDVLIAKFDSSGTLQWDRTLGDSSNDYAQGVAIDSSDNIIIAGHGYFGGSWTGFVAKYNSSGVIQWQKKINTGSSDYIRKCAVDSSDNIIVVGATSGTGAGSNDGLIVKYNSSGTVQWKRLLGGSSSEVFYAVEVDSSDNIFVGGYTASDGAGNYDFLMAKYNSSGVLQFDKTLGGSNQEFSQGGIAIDSSDNVIFSFYTNSVGAGNYDAGIVKYNNSGVFQWDKILGGSGNDYYYNVAVDSSDNIYGFGWTASDGAGSNDFLLAKYNSSGVIQWQKNLGGTASEVGYSVTVDSSDNIIIAGATTTGSEALIAKVPSDGSGDGTYGSFTYQDSALTDANPSLTDALAVLTDASATSVSSSDASLTDAAAVLTDQLTEITV
jgi:uncharacterized delta-60 repeat protein